VNLPPRVTLWFVVPDGIENTSFTINIGKALPRFPVDCPTLSKWQGYSALGCCWLPLPFAGSAFETSPDG